MPVVLNIGFMAAARTTRCDREWKRLTSRENGAAHGHECYVTEAIKRWLAPKDDQQIDEATRGSIYIAIGKHITGDQSIWEI